MTDDIVTRLRDVGFCGVETQREAADEIEQLRADRDRWRKIAQGEHYAWSQCAYGCNCMVELHDKAVRGE